MLNAALSFDADSIDVLNPAVAFAIALGSPDSNAVLNLKADAANLASVLPVKEDAASSIVAASPLPSAAAALNNVAAVLTSVGTLAPPKVRPEFTTPIMLPLSSAFKPPATVFVVLIRFAFCARTLLS